MTLVLGRVSSRRPGSLHQLSRRSGRLLDNNTSFADIAAEIGQDRICYVYVCSFSNERKMHYLKLRVGEGGAGVVVGWAVSRRRCRGVSSHVTSMIQELLIGLFV